MHPTLDEIELNPIRGNVKVFSAQHIYDTHRNALRDLHYSLEARISVIDGLSRFAASDNKVTEAHIKVIDLGYPYDTALVEFQLSNGEVYKGGSGVGDQQGLMKVHFNRRKVPWWGTEGETRT